MHIKMKIRWWRNWLKIGKESEDLVNTEMYYNNGNFGIAYNIVGSENDSNEFQNKMKKSRSKIIYSL